MNKSRGDSKPYKKDFGEKRSFGGKRYDSKPAFGRPTFGNKPFNNERSGDSEYTPPDMFKAICDDCGKNSAVPFKPTQGKPVYCRDCFRKRNDSNVGFSRSEPRGNSGSNDILKISEQIASLNYKLDKILKALNS